MITLGIDLASRNGKTGLCQMAWAHDGSVTVAEPEVGHFEDGLLVDRIKSVQKAGGWVGIDAPFGFPIAFTEGLSTWERRSRIEPFAGLTFEDGCCPRCRAEGWDPLIRRYTDMIVHTRLKVAKGLTGSSWPLSSVVERITPTTVRCAQLLSKTTRSPVDRVGLGKSRVVEVYPKAALTLWGFSTEGYKATENTTARRDLVKRLKKALGGATLSSTFAGSDDCIDALVSACIARAVACGQTDEPDLPAGHASEGWIHLPTKGRTMRDLLSGSSG